MPGAFEIKKSRVHLVSSISNIVDFTELSPEELAAGVIKIHTALPIS